MFKKIVQQIKKYLCVILTMSERVVVDSSQEEDAPQQQPTSREPRRLGVWLEGSQVRAWTHHINDKLSWTEVGGATVSL